MNAVGLLKKKKLLIIYIVFMFFKKKPSKIKHVTYYTYLSQKKTDEFVYGEQRNETGITIIHFLINDDSSAFGSIFILKRFLTYLTCAIGTFFKKKIEIQKAGLICPEIL